MTPPAPDPGTGLLARPDASARLPIATLVALHDRDVRSALRRVLGRSQEEDDLVQEVFTRLVVRLRQPGELCVGAWVRGVAHNLAVDEIRRRRPVPVDDVRLDRQVFSTAEDAIAGDDLYRRLVDGASRLPDRQRAALAAALSTGSPGVATVASSLGVSVHAAESLLSRARVGLRKELAMAGDNDTGSARLSVVAVLAVVAAALGAVLRRWRAVAAVTVTSGVLAGSAVIPALHGPSARSDRRAEPVTSSPAWAGPLTPPDHEAPMVPANDGADGDGAADRSATSRARAVPATVDPARAGAGSGIDDALGPVLGAVPPVGLGEPLAGVPLPELGGVTVPADELCASVGPLLGSAANGTLDGAGTRVPCPPLVEG